MQSTKQFERMISRLIAQRAQHSKSLAQIDQVFARYGIQVRADADQLRQARLYNTTRRTRGRFSETGEAFVLNVVRSKKNPTTAQINAAWKAAGRAGTADNALVKLVKQQSLKRTPVPNGRGSHYSLI